MSVKLIESSLPTGAVEGNVVLSSSAPSWTDRTQPGAPTLLLCLVHFHTLLQAEEHNPCWMLYVMTKQALVLEILEIRCLHLKQNLFVLVRAPCRANVLGQEATKHAPTASGVYSGELSVFLICRCTFV